MGHEIKFPVCARQRDSASLFEINIALHFAGKPRLHLLAFSTSSNNIHWDKTGDDDCHLDYRHRNIRFNYIGLSYTAAQNVRYHYRLRGFQNDWGAAGKIWVDYRFFLENFVFAAFVATPDNNVNPNDDNLIDPDDRSSGTDLAAYHAYDVGGNFGGRFNRQLFFNIYNAGTASLASSKRYSIVYIYYNAFDANDYGVLTDIHVTDQIARGAVQPSQRAVEGYCSYDVNKDIPAGTSIASAFFGNNYEYLYMTYSMPNTLNGYYYFVVMADPYNNVPEANEQNNLFFIADPNGYPYYVMNGVPQTRSGATRDAATLPTFGRAARDAGIAPAHSLVPQNRNAYSPDEIRALIRDRKAAGELDKRIREFDASRQAPEIGGQAKNRQ